MTKQWTCSVPLAFWHAYKRCLGGMLDIRLAIWGIQQIEAEILVMIFEWILGCTEYRCEYVYIVWTCQILYKHASLQLCIPGKDSL